jgi:hypothetical protein
MSVVTIQVKKKCLFALICIISISAFLFIECMLDDNRTRPISPCLYTGELFIIFLMRCLLFLMMTSRDAAMNRQDKKISKQKGIYKFIHLVVKQLMNLVLIKVCSCTFYPVRLKPAAFRYIGGDCDQMLNAGGCMPEKIRFVFFEPQQSIGAKSLCQPLCHAFKK